MKNLFVIASICGVLFLIIYPLVFPFEPRPEDQYPPQLYNENNRVKTIVGEQEGLIASVIRSRGLFDTRSQAKYTYVVRFYSPEDGFTTHNFSDFELKKP